MNKQSAATKIKVIITMLILTILYPLPSSATEKTTSPLFYDIMNQSMSIVKKEDSLTVQDDFTRVYTTLDQLVSLYAKATNKPLSLPVGPEGLSTQMTDTLDSNAVSNALIVTKGGKITRLNNSVVLVDGNADISYSDNSIIIASGAVLISHGTNNTILAGQFVHVSHDGSQMRTVEEAAIKRSIIMSGYRVDISNATYTIISAPGLAAISHSYGVVLMNSPHQDISHKENMAELKSSSLTYPPSPSVSPLKDDWGHSFSFEDLIVFRKTDGTWGRFEIPQKN